MAPPIYFIPRTTKEKFRPGGGKLATDALASCRLDSVLADVPVGRMMISDLHKPGPGGEHGMLLRAEPAGGGMSDRFDFLPDQQSWRGVVDPGDHSRQLYWIGIDNLQPPKPADLQRLKMLDGHVIKLADGQLWQAPMVRRPPTIDGGHPHVTTFPCKVEFGFGTSQRLIADDYVAMWDRSGRVFDILWGGDALRQDEGSLLDMFSLECLSLNYRVGPYEANALGVLDTLAVTAVVNAAIGITFFEEQKKN